MYRTILARWSLSWAVVALVMTASVMAQSGTVRVTGVVRDEQNAITLPGVSVSVRSLNLTTFTDVDGQYFFDLPPGEHELTIAMDGYQERKVRITAGSSRVLEVDVPLAMTRFAEEVTVTADAIDATSSSQEAQLVERKNAQVVEDNLGSQEMRENGDTDAAQAMARVTGLSVVDNQYIFVRGLGERYSNTLFGGAVLPTTEPDKKVVPLDLFPASLIESVQVAKTYSPDKTAEFAGGLVQIIPVSIANRPVMDMSFGLDWYENSTGEEIVISPIDGGSNYWGYDQGANDLPGGVPSSKIVRQGIYTPDVGFTRDQITQAGRLFPDVWSPGSKDGDLGSNWNVSFGNRYGHLGLIASLRQSYKERYLQEQASFFRLGENDALEPVNEYDIQRGEQIGQLSGLANLAYQFTPNHRLGYDNFFTHVGRDEGRFFEGPNFENNFIYRNLRYRNIEEGLYSGSATGDHFFQNWGNSRIDWRATYNKATRDEPNLRETLYQSPLTGGDFLLADESQSGFLLYADQDDMVWDFAANWATLLTVAGRPMQLKFGPQYIRRERDFSSRRFRYIPTNAAGGPALTLAPEQIFTTNNIGPYYRFNEETRPVDAYRGEQETFALYAMGDFVLSGRARLVAGLRVEDFDERVDTFNPFALVPTVVPARIQETDIFPGVNVVYALTPQQNLRLGFSQTTNRPEFRELAAYEFTDVVGNRAVVGNPDLERALIQNYDARWEFFPGGRSVFAASFFYKNFDQPIERVVFASAQPLASFENADSARDYGIELEAGYQVGPNFFFNVNYTYVDSKVTLTEAQAQVQTSLERPLGGQSPNLFNATAEYAAGGFQARVLYNFFDDRISDVGANGAPDIIEESRGTLDAVLIQRLGRAAFRVTFDNLTDPTYRFTQGDQDQRTFKYGRSITFSVGYSFF